MLKLAKFFFKHQHVTVNTLEDFFKSDLCFYFEKLYKTKLRISNTGFIKIVRRGPLIDLYENVFYDWANQESDEYITFEGVDMRPGFITNTEAGKQLSQKGYYAFPVSPKDISRTIEPVTKLRFDSHGCERETEPNAMFRFGDVWEDPQMDHRITYEAYSMFHQMNFRMTHLLNFSNVLLSLDAYDMICLKWSHSRSILPHNDLDIRMFVNMVSYWDETYEHRYLKVGEYDWYDYLFPILLMDNWEETNNITAPKTELDKILSHRYVSPVVNVFNPKFYHETTPLKSGQMYSISSHKSFKAIVNKMELSR